MDNEQPLVSIISFCKDRASTIRRSIESVLSQSYRNIEFVVQDGASTDGTIEILQSYNDPRIKLVSQPDAGHAEAYWKVLNRCAGDIIATCLSDEELLPGAIAFGVEQFLQYPHVGAITCDGYVCNAEGKITGEFNAGDFNLVDYLFGSYCPFWPGSFFSRQALIDIGLKDHKFNIDCLEFEIWCRLATRHQVKYIPHRVSKYGVHTGQLSNTPKKFHEHFDSRTILIKEMFSENGFFGKDNVKLRGCLYNQFYLLYAHVKTYKMQDQVRVVSDRIQALKREVNVVDRIKTREYFNFLDNNLVGRNVLVDDAHVFRRISGVWLRLSLGQPAFLRGRVPPPIKRFAKAFLTIGLFLAFRLKAVMSSLPRGFTSRRHGRETSEPLFVPAFSKKLYHDTAQIYYSRGQIDQAIQMWRSAEELNDPTIDGLACQAMLMSPTAKQTDLLAIQKRWAARHAAPIDSVRKIGKPYDSARKINVAYCCAFFDSDLIRTMLLGIVKRHDRSKVRVFGYSTTHVSSQISDAFDEFKVTGLLSDREFVGTVRSDSIDILIEVSGFSPHNRLSAMGSRCAPVQISYLNHSGTTGVPNIDHVLADDVSVPPGDDQFYSEKIWRLQGGFLCYNYDWVDPLPISTPPRRKNGFVTFGCFGSGGKINDRLIALWADILNRSPNSHFFVRNHQLSMPDNRRFMLERFGRHGIPPDRLKVLGGCDRETILKNYGEIDVSLDTWPYCGGNTVAESLWQGVPVITLKGDRFSSRYGASLLLTAGCDELIANTPEEYIDLAVRLAEQPTKLTYYRENLRRIAREFGLSDAAAFARKLDAAYLQMMESLLPGRR